MVKLCVAGKNDIAINVLRYALTFLSPDCIVACCNLTDSGVDGWQRSYRRFAISQGVRVLELKDVEIIQNLIFISLEFDRLVKPERFVNACLYNLHFSLLPRYKGMYTSAWPILEGVAETGVTLHEIDPGIDTGPIIAQRRFLLSSDLTCEALYLRYLDCGVELVCEWLPTILTGAVDSEPQAAEGASYFSRRSINYQSLVLDLNKTAVEIKRQIQAYSHRRYQLLELYGRRIVGASVNVSSSFFPPGALLCEDACSITISTIDYDLQVWVDRQDELFAAAECGDLVSVRTLLRNQCYIDERNFQGKTLLMVAAENEHLELLRMLLAEGASVQAYDFHGRSVLHYASQMIHDLGLLDN